MYRNAIVNTLFLWTGLRLWLDSAEEHVGRVLYVVVEL